MNWRDLTAAEREIHFSPRLAIPDFESYFEWQEEMSRAATTRLDGELDIRYGDGPLAVLDVHRPDGNATAAPIFIFIHGGYWRSSDKLRVRFAVEPFVRAGALAINVNYDLCPDVTLDTIVAEIRQAVAWAWREGRRFGGDPDRLFIAGHSAGAHLAVMAMTHDWVKAGLPGNPIRGATSISGIFDLEPVLHIAVNQDVRMDGDMARRNSPMRQPPVARVPLLIAVGDEETAGWIAQSIDFHAACRARGVQADLWRMGGHNHLSILQPLGDPRHPLTVAMLRQMGL